jgi:hypothetical protein
MICALKHQSPHANPHFSIRFYHLISSTSSCAKMIIADGARIRDLGLVWGFAGEAALVSSTQPKVIVSNPPKGINLLCGCPRLLSPTAAFDNMGDLP